ncbi:MAG: Gfo/Idh/MocA family oxidoreductase, partial [Victivallales bacterium]|nr:Gfo/Idh/MocA family oxidoreductase [Victivallales bacterium]
MAVKKLRYGIIGAGGCGANKHLASYSKLSNDVEIVAICDIRREVAEYWANALNARAYTDYNAMLKKEKLDLVSVATPNAVHAPATIAALAAGCHVHCEKPASLTAELVQSMVDAKNKAKRILMIGLNNRFTNWASVAREYIASGAVGEIYHAKCAWKRRRGIPGKGGWFTTKELSGGGPLIDLGVHYIDVTNWLLGFPQPERVSGAIYSKFADTVAFNPAASGYTGTYDVEDMATGLVRYKNDMTLDIEFSWASNIAAEYTTVEIYGTQGGLCYDSRNAAAPLRFFGTIGNTVTDTIPSLAPEGEWGNAETRYLVDCIRSRKVPHPKAEEAVLVMKSINALYE